MIQRRQSHVARLVTASDEKSRLPLRSSLQLEVSYKSCIYTTISFFHQDIAAHRSSYTNTTSLD